MRLVSMTGARRRCSAMVESNNVGLVLRLFLGGVVVGITSSASHFCGTSSITFIPWLPSLVVDARCPIVRVFLLLFIL
jgi:hypothetical protein